MSGGATFHGLLIVMTIMILLLLAMEDVENNCPTKCSFVVGNSGGVAAPAP